MPKPISLKELAKLTHCKLVGNEQYLIDNVANLEEATPSDASFLANPRYQQAMHKSEAGVVFIDLQTPYNEGKNYLISNEPSKAFQQVVDIFFPQRKYPTGFKGIHPSAIIHASAQLSEDVVVGPYAVIDEGARVGKGTFIGAGVFLGPDVTVGNECLIHSGVIIRDHCQIGNRVIIQPGAVIGACGFGYLTDKQGKHTKLNQVGYVIIEDDVEIGANTTIDRARFKSTVIGQGSKIDNLVQIGHGVQIGPHNIIVAQTGIAGSTSTGRNVVIAGQVAVAGHLHLDEGTMIAGKSGVSKSLSKGKYNGIPAIPVSEYNRNAVYLRQIEKYINQIKKLESRLEALEAQQS